VAWAWRHDEETMMKTGAMIAALGMLIAPPVAAQEMFFLPSRSVRCVP
jgi:hypothetical protein